MSKLRETVTNCLSAVVDGLFVALGVMLGLLLIGVMLALLIGVLYMFASSECIQLPGNGLLCLT